MEVKFQFFLTIATAFKPFLTKYQTDIPMLPFLAEDLTKLIKGLLKHFVKEKNMELKAARISQMDVSDKTTWVAHNEVDIGIGADLALNALRKSGSISDLRVMEFKQDCLQSLSSMCKKILEKSPLNFSVVRQMSCLDPRCMYRSPKPCQKLTRKLVEKLLQDHHNRNSAEADVIIQQYSEFLDKEASFEDFDLIEPGTRVDTFLNSKMKGYPKLMEMCRKLLLLCMDEPQLNGAFQSTKKFKLATCILRPW